LGESQGRGEIEALRRIAGHHFRPCSRRRSTALADIPISLDGIFRSAGTRGFLFSKFSTAKNDAGLKSGKKLASWL
jgi:hypothetical protein